MKLRFININLIWIFLLSCQGNHKESVLKTDSINDTMMILRIDSQLIRSPFDSLEIRNFKSSVDSIIQIALNDKKKSYKLIIDTFNNEKKKNVGFDYFDSDSLIETIELKFRLSQYSFEVSRYKYRTENSAVSILKKVATIDWIQINGLTKSPNYIFRINNYVFWFTFPNSFSKNTLNTFTQRIDETFRNKYPNLDMIESYAKTDKLTKLDREYLVGNWTLKYLSNIHKSDTIRNNYLDKKRLTITDSSIIFAGKEVRYKFISRVNLPDAEALFQYYDWAKTDLSDIVENLKKRNVPFIWYLLLMETDILDTKAVEMKNIFENIYKYENGYLFILNDNKIYELVKN